MSGSSSLAKEKLSNLTSAFGEVSVAQPTASVLAHFPYNLNTDMNRQDQTMS